MKGFSWSSYSLGLRLAIIPRVYPLQRQFLTITQRLNIQLVERKVDQRSLGKPRGQIRASSWAVPVIRLLVTELRALGSMSGVLLILTMTSI